MAESMTAQRGSLQSVLLSLVAVGFAAWAGVVLWGITAINDRLTDLQASMQRVEGEMVEFKLGVTERVVRVETKIDAAHADKK